MSDVVPFFIVIYFVLHPFLLSFPPNFIRYYFVIENFTSLFLWFIFYMVNFGLMIKVTG